MAPVVHGLEKQYAGRVDFLYLNVADARNDSAERALRFVSTPHFFFLRDDGTATREMQGVVTGNRLRDAIQELLGDAESTRQED